MTPETSILNRIRLSLSKKGVITWRNNTGRLQDKTGRWVKYGLCVGSSDIIGIQPVVITPDMVGQTIGRFVAIEVKRKGKNPRPNQERFLNAIIRSGGVAGVATDEKEAKEIVRNGQ